MMSPVPRSPITTHVLDVSLGKPAVGVSVILEIAQSDGGWKELGRGETDASGRLENLIPSAALSKGRYRLTFNTEPYFALHNTAGFYPQVTVIFFVKDEAEHYHVPLLLSPYGYSTYRGS